MSDFSFMWILIRVSGFLGFYFMSFSLSMGLLSSLSLMKRKKVLLVSLHEASGWYGLLTIIFHMFLIWQDQYVPYSFGELLIPFYAKYEPVYSTLGVFSFYLFLLVIGSSDFFIKKLGLKFWKKIHFVVIPAWVFMLIHGLAIGTDSSKLWALCIYLFGSSFIIVLLSIRIMDFVMMRQSSRGRPN